MNAVSFQIYRRAPCLQAIQSWPLKPPTRCHVLLGYVPYLLSLPRAPPHGSNRFPGYKFETLATLPDVWDSQSRDTIESRNLEPVSNEAQFCSIVKTSFGPTKLIIGGEVDAVWDTHSSNPTYAELKTSKTPSTDKDRTTFARKLHRFWAQSFLLNVRKVIVGFRDDNGILRSFEEFETSDLPALAKKYAGRPLWDGKLSIEFAASLLAWIKDSINNDPGREGKVWRIRYRENSPVIEIFRVDGTVFLSDEFLKWRKGIDTAREE
ncbi:decapping endonuclease targeting mRNA [Rhizina undulata]